MPPAARGSRKVLIPRHNEKDLLELPPEVKADMTFHLVDTLDDVVPHLFPEKRTAARKPKASPRRGKAPKKARPLPPPDEKPARRPRSV